MKIALNVGSMHGGHSLRGTGIYTRELLSALRKNESGHEYMEFDDTTHIPASADIVHYPYFDPFFLTLPVAIRPPFIVTVHDLIPIVNQTHFPRGLRGEVKWQIQRFALTRATSIITDSMSSKKDIVSTLRCPDNKVHVVYLAPRSEFHTITDQKRLNKVREKYKLSNKSVLYVGDINWNKNVINMIKSFDTIDAKVYPNLQFLLVGKAFIDDKTAESREIDKVIADCKSKLRIRKLGFVSDDELASLYTLASVLISPSFAEGFGFPVVEAMACGCPVVTSEISSLKEIAGPSIVINPLSVENIAHGIMRVLDMTDEERKVHIQKGFDWVKQYSWKRVAHETVSVYDQVLINR